MAKISNRFQKISLKKNICNLCSTNVFSFSSCIFEMHLCSKQLRLFCSLLLSYNKEFYSDLQLFCCSFMSWLSTCSFSALSAYYPRLNNDSRGWNTSQDCWWLSLGGIWGEIYKDVFSSLSEIRTWHSAQASAKAPWSRGNGASFKTFMETWAHTWHLVRFPSLRPKRTAKKASVFRTSVACWAVKKD